MAIGTREHLATRLPTLKPQLNPAANPIRLLRSLGFQQWLFFLVRYSHSNVIALIGKQYDIMSHLLCFMSFRNNPGVVTLRPEDPQCLIYYEELKCLDPESP
jgi:hypothetical protein